MSSHRRIEKGGNQAVAARLGAEVYFIGKVGADERGEFVMNELKQSGSVIAAIHADVRRSRTVPA